MMTGPANPTTRGPSGRAAVWIRRLVSCAALLSVMTLVVLSWLPQDVMARTGAPGLFEHIAAYAGASVLSAVGVDGPGRRWLGLAFVTLASILEAGQILIPGRTAQVADAAASISGAIVGIAVVCVPAWPLLGQDRRQDGDETAQRILPVSLIVLGVAVTPIWIGLLAWLTFRTLSSLLD